MCWSEGLCVCLVEQPKNMCILYALSACRSLLKLQTRIRLFQVYVTLYTLFFSGSNDIYIHATYIYIYTHTSPASQISIISWTLWLLLSRDATVENMCTQSTARMTPEFRSAVLLFLWWLLSRLAYPRKAGNLKQYPRASQQMPRILVQ